MVRPAMMAIRMRLAASNFRINTILPKYSVSVLPNMVRSRRFSGLAVASGAPDKALSNKVTIYIPARTASQQGIENTKKWLVEFDKEDRRWANPLMGWTSGKQTTRQLHLQFDSKEDAVAYCEKQGFEFEIKEPKKKKKFVKAYADNFKYKPN
eukprot:CAMPEP_0185263374 /NCGR_PEP_ID=MMETSP1359-20130426/14656_1 /TAXON_ID=552665 /ORGANISM="Bigelowiella longifila, Strain CCMP242" /LENGTH=152 /DNA_ID=CAMNT_0027850869 /DNA_START=31 /DNA_END=489 /DNA_ORIENTATION=+